MIAPTQHEVLAADGQPLATAVFEASGVRRGVVLVVPAMGVPQRYYHPFCEWLAEHGFTTLTFEYRGMGLSRHGTLRGFETDIVKWAQLDCAAMVDVARQRVPDGRFIWIGHSLGGQIFPLVPNREKVDKVITVAAGSGYWRENAWPTNRYVWTFWYLLVPLLTPLFGYFPGGRLGAVGDLPRGVVEQWRRWCLNREYLIGAEGPAMQALFDEVRTPIVSLSFTDDELMSARNIESLHGFYRHAPRTMKRIAPPDVGVKRIGHFGFFRRAFEGSLWDGQLLPELG